MRRHAKAPSATTRVWRFGLTYLLAALLLAAGFAPPASAATFFHPFISSFGPDGTSATNFQEKEAGLSIMSTAVDQSNGDLYLISGQTLYRFTTNGVPKPFTAGPGAGTNKITGFGFDIQEIRPQVAVAPPGALGGTAGDVYVASQTGLHVLSSTGAPLGVIDGSGNPHPHSLTTPLSGVAVDPAGNVYVAYSAESRLDKYVPSGNPLVNADFDSEVNNVGSVCSPSASSTHVFLSSCFEHWGIRYPLSLFPGSGGLADGTGQGVIFGGAGFNLPGGQFSQGSSAGTAVDPSNGDFYNASPSGITRFDKDGNILARIKVPHEPRSVAVDATSGRVFIPDAGSGPKDTRQIRIYGPGIPVEPPTAEIDPASSITFKSAHFGGSVNAGGSGEAQATTYRFECTPSCPGLQGNRSVAADGSPHAVSDDTTDLQPGTKYEVTLIASNLAGEVKDTVSFETSDPPVQLPTATIDLVADVSSTTATFSGSVDPGGPEEYQEATYRFEYVEEEDYFSTGFDQAVEIPVPHGDIAPGNAPVPVSEPVTGLVPNTTYYVRLVAENGAGEVASATPDPSFTTEAVPPLAEVTGASNVLSMSARLNGRINARHSQTSYRFEWGTADCASNPCASTPVADAGTGNDFAFVSADLSGLAPSTTYTYRLIAESDAGSVTTSSASFTTTASEGACSNQGMRNAASVHLADCRAYEMVSPPDKNGANIIPDNSRARAEPGGNAMQFHSLAGFADVQGSGVATDYMARRTAAPATNGWSTHGIIPQQKPVALPAIVPGLEPHYAGEFSADFKRGLLIAYSPVAGASGADPNVVNRANLYLRTDLSTPGAGSYQLLSACPACTSPLVNDTDNLAMAGANAGDADHQALTNVAYESYRDLTPDAAAAKLPIADPKLYEGTERPGDEVQEVVVDAASGSFVLAFDGQSTADIAFDAPANGPGSVAEALNSLASISPGSVSVAGGPGDAGGTSPYAVSFDSGEGIEATDVPAMTAGPGSTPLAGGAATATVATRLPGGQHVRLVGRIPSGNEASCDDRGAEACVASTAIAGTDLGVSGLSAHYAYHAVSDDGSRILFRAPAEGALQKLYLREDGVKTVMLNASEASSPGTAQTTEYWTAGSDASRIFFSTTERLVDEDVNSSSDLYMYDATKPEDDPENLTLISKGSGGSGNFNTVIGASDDGTLVYFTAGQLLANQPVGGSGLYLWRDGKLALIGAFNGSSGDATLNSPAASKHNKGVLVTARISPSGRHLFFMARQSDGFAGHGGFEGYDHGNACTFDENVGSPCRQLFVYSADSGELRCASCNPGGTATTPLGDALSHVQELKSAAETALRPSHAISRDGRYVFFHTGEPLVPEDTNGQIDVYAYDTVTEDQQLISTGESSAPSYFMDASSSGRDVFIITRQRLSGWDVDDSYDVYDARVNGGLPEPEPLPPSCQGDACQPAPNPRDEQTPASAGFSGPGDGRVDRPTSRQGRCSKGKRRVKTRSGKTRCVKKARNAKQSGRAGR